jgi:hypothetical protein
MYRTFAERESALFSQVLLAYQRQRNPEARARLQDELVELASLGRRLRTVLLRDAVGTKTWGSTFSSAWSRNLRAYLAKSAALS